MLGRSGSDAKARRAEIKSFTDIGIPPDHAREIVDGMDAYGEDLYQSLAQQARRLKGADLKAERKERRCKAKGNSK